MVNLDYGKQNSYVPTKSGDGGQWTFGAVSPSNWQVPGTSPLGEKSYPGVELQRVVDITQVSVEEDKGLVNGTTATSSFDQDEDLCDSARELIGFYKKQYEKIIGEAHEIQEFISEKTHSIKQWEGALRMAEEAIAKLKSSIGTEILRASSRNRSFSEFSPEFLRAMLGLW